MLKSLGIQFYSARDLHIQKLNVISYVNSLEKKNLGVGCELSWGKSEVESFGRRTRRPDLREVVCSLYDAALQESSQKTYRTGQRAFLRFAVQLHGPSPPLPFGKRPLGNTELHLAFFMA